MLICPFNTNVAFKQQLYNYCSAEGNFLQTTFFDLNRRAKHEYNGEKFFFSK